MPSSHASPARLRLDHLVLTVADLRRTARFYEAVLGFVFREDAGRAWLDAPDGGFRINLHAVGHERTPHAKAPTPGSADLCFVSEDELERRLAQLTRVGVAVELGPVLRPGAGGTLESLYFRDPDGNLIEWAKVV